MFSDSDRPWCPHTEADSWKKTDRFKLRGYCAHGWAIHYYYYWISQLFHTSCWPAAWHEKREWYREQSRPMCVCVCECPPPLYPSDVQHPAYQHHVPHHIRTHTAPLTHQALPVMDGVYYSRIINRQLHIDNHPATEGELSHDHTLSISCPCFFFLHQMSPESLHYLPVFYYCWLISSSARIQGSSWISSVASSCQTWYWTWYFATNKWDYVWESIPCHTHRGWYTVFFYFFTVESAESLPWRLRVSRPLDWVINQFQTPWVVSTHASYLVKPLLNASKCVKRGFIETREKSAREELWCESPHSVIVPLCSNSSVDRITAVISQSLLFPVELMEVGIQHQAENQPRKSEEIQKTD